MGIRYQQRIRILPGLYLNISKGGISFSFGPRGVKTTVGKRGVRTSFGLAGSGLRYETSWHPIGKGKRT